MSVEPERVFRSAKITLDDRRCQLSDEAVNALECLKSWHRDGLISASHAEITELEDMLNALWQPLGLDCMMWSRSGPRSGLVGLDCEEHWCTDYPICLATQTPFGNPNKINIDNRNFDNRINNNSNNNSNIDNRINNNSNNNSNIDSRIINNSNNNNSNNINITVNIFGNVGFGQPGNNFWPPYQPPLQNPPPVPPAVPPHNNPPPPPHPPPAQAPRRPLQIRVLYFRIGPIGKIHYEAEFLFLVRPGLTWMDLATPCVHTRGVPANQLAGGPWLFAHRHSGDLQTQQVLDWEGPVNGLPDNSDQLETLLWDVANFSAALQTILITS
ncbi:hypothetical protein FN846DRAFT_986801 [Sphaerosporella brunnea]|uniref:HAT C-terminal dimerisation domain-containing protein n=1 Tax=Sphaerosporella brunnea TaxID=1250544 RepID=A0A5J5EUB5_9PEZI|nr:hypothetical protein FN846DRAFT_986801 [Sphaerosporella brunnea]